MSTRLLVTGMPRSGTTLVDKLLSSHPQAHVLSQPLPLLYVRIKRAFLESRPTAGREPLALRYPLNDMFGPNYYPPAELRQFLESFRLSRELCRQTLEEMVPFDGQYTKPSSPFQVLEGYRPAPLHDFVERYCEPLVATGQPRIAGTKEAYCEEYTPYYLSSGARVLEILRDPRDILTSLNSGHGPRFGGRSKPHLFNLRQWRKSVAFALAHRAQPGFLAVRYEDLVRDPPSVTARITDFLELDRFAPEILRGDLKSQSGERWSSNSSSCPATRIVTDSIGRYRRHLSRETDLFVQAVCFAEMKELGYEVEIGEGEVLPILARYLESGPAERPELGSYLWSEDRYIEEQARWQSMGQGTFEPAWFLFEEAFLSLRRWRQNGGQR